MTAAAPTEAVRIGVVGAGRWGPNLIRNFHNRQTSVVAGVVDRSAERRAMVQAHYPDVAVHDNVDALLEDASVSAVVVATPASTHFEFARRALLAGKHVMVEKPLTDSSRDALELCELADRQQRLLMVGHVFVHNPAIRHVKSLLDEGALGDVHYIAMVRTNLGPAGIDVNVAWDLATHDVSIANFWLDSAPLTASASGGCWIEPGKADTIFATLAYPGGRLVNLNVSWLSPRKTREITVVGDRRMLTVDDMHLTDPIRLHDKRIVPEEPAFVDSFGTFRASIRDGDIVIPHVPAGEPLRDECAHFVECVRTGTRPITDGRSALPVIRAVEAITRSLDAHGCEQAIEP